MEAALVIGALFCFEFISSVQTRHNGKPSIGFASYRDNDGLKSVHNQNFLTPAVKRYTKKENARSVDSYFKVMKTSPQNFKITTDVTDYTVNEERKNAIPKLQYDTNDNKVARKINSDLETGNTAAIRISKDSMNHKENSRNLHTYRTGLLRAPQKKDKSYDPNFLQVNVRKLQIINDPLKVKISNSRQVTSLHKVNTKATNKVPIYAVHEKPVHNPSTSNDRIAKMINKVVEDLSQKILDRQSIKASDSKKRETVYNPDFKHNVMENIKKYFGKDKNVIKENRVETPRIGSRSENLNDETSYALFYRTNSEILDHEGNFLRLDNNEQTLDNNQYLLTDHYNKSNIKNPLKLRWNFKKLTNFRNH